MTRARIGAIAAKLALRALLAGSVLVLAFVGLGPHTGRYRTLTVLSGSMRPSIHPGDVVVVTPRPASDLSVGDVLVYNAPVDDQRVVAHRVVEVVDRHPEPVIRTKGDANDAPDPWLARIGDDTVWVVRATVPRLGTVISVMRHPALQRLAVLGVPGVLALLWLRQIWTRDEAADEQEDAHAPVPTAGLGSR